MRRKKDELEFLVIPSGENCVEANEAIWSFLAARGDGDVDRVQCGSIPGGKDITGIRVTQDEVEVIKGAAKTFHFHFRILSINPRTEEVREHFNTSPSPFPQISRG